MRLILALALISLACGTAAAEMRTFVLNSDADGYGVDRCLATGASCGDAIARAYCRSLEFAEARSFRTLDRDETADGQIACRGNCRDLVAIECTR